MVLTEYNEAQTMKTYFDEGKAEGIKEGSNTTLYELVEAGDLSLSKAAKKAGVSEEQFKRNMLLTGHCIS